MSPIDGARRRVRFFPDSGHPWSLWEEPTGAVPPEDFGLSDALSLLLELWTRHWEENYDPFRGWSSEEARVRSKALGDEIATRLPNELGPDIEFADRRSELDR